MSSFRRFVRGLVFLVMGALFTAGMIGGAPVAAEPRGVVVLDMSMMILPGTSNYLTAGIATAVELEAPLIIVRLNTPGGLLDTSQEMVQAIFASPVPIGMYVSPTGGTATSAGVFITLAGHVAAMAPGTSIGAAHPVAGDGKDIEGDMRAKAENMTAAMVKSIAEQRGRNAGWAERAVRESISVSEPEALKLGVVDLVAKDIPELLTRIKGRTVKMVDQKSTVLDDYSALPLVPFEMPLRDRVINTFAHPNVVALLWLGATTGLSLELYNPGAVIPGVVGVICLILALAVGQIIPLNVGAIMLLVVGALLIGAEMFFPSFILGIGGIVALALGALYLIDGGAAPGLAVDPAIVLPPAVLLGALMLAVVAVATRTFRRRAVTGAVGLIGQRGRALENFTSAGKVFVNGEIWRATAASGIVEKDATVEVVRLVDRLTVEVRPVESR
jgi:membrane-bound serine protease (ClpP class)